jgi:hypothetical protein
MTFSYQKFPVNSIMQRLKTNNTASTADVIYSKIKWADGYKEFMYTSQ